MSDKLDFNTDDININLLLIDSSSSMEGNTRDVIEGLKAYKKSFENFAEASTLAISVNRFNEDYYASEFKGVEDFDINYSTNGGTAIYYSICVAAEQLLAYMNKIAEEKGCITKQTFILLSDGEPCHDKASFEDAKEAIEKLKMAGVNTVFVAFGSAIERKAGNDLGFQVSVDVNDRNVLRDFLGVELSKSCKEQSRSMKSLGENFFSKADGNSEKFSRKTEQALEDKSWMDI